MLSPQSWFCGCKIASFFPFLFVCLSKPFLETLAFTTAKTASSCVTAKLILSLRKCLLFFFFLLQLRKWYCRNQVRNNDDRRCIVLKSLFIQITAALSLVCRDDSHLWLALTYFYGPRPDPVRICSCKSPREATNVPFTVTPFEALTGTLRHVHR